jgi:hypothetical protein
MKREIQFKAKDQSGKWNYGYFVKDFEGNAYITSLDGENTCLVIEETLCQRTGILSKEGFEIYESDFIKVPDDYDTYGMNAGEVYEIFFNAGGFRCKPKINPKARGIWLEDDREFQIVGNIHSNPELIY